MVMGNLKKISLVLAICAAGAIAYADKTLHVIPINGGYQVYDPSTGKAVYTRDLKGYLKELNKNSNVDGFNGRISYKSFKEGTNPVGEVAQDAANTVGTAANTATNVAHRIPSWRRYTAPLRSLFGSTQNQQPR